MPAVRGWVDQHRFHGSGIGRPHDIAAPQIAVHSCWLVIGCLAQYFRQRFNDGLSQFHIVISEFTALHTKLYHRTEPAFGQICRHIIPFACVHGNGILQGAEITSSRISGWGRSKVIGSGIMHTCESSAEIMRGLQSRTTGVHSFNVEIILAPVVHVYHTWPAFGLRFAKPLQTTALAFEETFRTECPALAIFAHAARPFLA